MHFICLLFQNALRAKNSLHKYTTLNYFPNPHAEIFDFLSAKHGGWKKNKY